MTAIRTFEMRGCRDVLAKLEREYDRVEATDGTPNRGALGDHGINFAVTAWHLVDWVWRDMAPMHPLKTEIARNLHLDSPRLRKSDFEDFLIRQRGLRYCRQIAVSFKHIGVDQWPGDTDAFGHFSAVATSVTALPENAPFGLQLREFVASPPNWHLKIIDGDERLRAVDIFREARDYWTSFIYGNNIDEVIEVDPGEL